MEQIPLDFSAPKKPIPPEKEKKSTADLEKLDDFGLQELYKKTVGIDPRFRGFDRATMIAGIVQPEQERDRIGEIDKLSDREELKKTYGR